MRFVVFFLLAMCCLLPDSSSVVAQFPFDPAEQHDALGGDGDYNRRGPTSLDKLFCFVVFLILLIAGGYYLFNWIRYQIDKVKAWTDAKLYFNRGGRCVDNGQYDKAIDDYSIALSFVPFTYAFDFRPPRWVATAYLQRGVAYGGLGQFDEAIADCTKAIEITPTFADAYYHRNLFYRELGETVNAILDLGRAERLGYKPPDEEE